MRDAATDPDLDSGPWSGFFTYPGSPRHHGMGLDLAFRDGVVRGEGWDDVGFFVLSGRYDKHSGECHWTKTYPGSHDVFYQGMWVGRWIVGMWEIAFERGGFRIRPGDGRDGESLVTAEEESVPVRASVAAAPTIVYPVSEEGGVRW